MPLQLNWIPGSIFQHRIMYISQTCDFCTPNEVHPDRPTWYPFVLAEDKNITQEQRQALETNRPMVVFETLKQLGYLQLDWSYGSGLTESLDIMNARIVFACICPKHKLTTTTL